MMLIIAIPFGRCEHEDGKSPKDRKAMWTVPADQAKPIFTPLLELRYRIERRIDRDFNSEKKDNRNDSLLRVRPGMEVKFNPKVTGRAVFQYLDNRSSLDVGIGSVKDNYDLLEGNVVFVNQKDKWTLGRQKVDLMDQRLLGALEWSNSARSWDGLRFQRDKWDVFAGRLAVNPVPNAEAKLAFASYQEPNGQSTLIFKKDDRPEQSTEVFTFAQQFKGTAASCKWSALGAIQFGKSGGKDLAAYAISARATRSLSKTTDGYVEVDIASGGGSGSKTRTFDNLYPTNHPYYGIMDMQGLRNMIGLSAALEHRCTPKLSVKFEAHHFWLYDGTDGWYNAAGALNPGFVDAKGGRGTDLGTELDFSGIYSFSPKQQLSAGVGVFIPGQFVKSFAAGHSRNQVWAYIMALWKL